MMKKLFKKKEKFPTPPVPRASKEINEEYTSICGQIGQAQYQKAVLEQQINAGNRRLSQLAEEADARQELDKASAAEAAKTGSQAGAQ